MCVCVRPCVPMCEWNLIDFIDKLINTHITVCDDVCVCVCLIVPRVESVNFKFYHKSHETHWIGSDRMRAKNILKW